MKEYWTSSDIKKVFRMSDRYKSIQALYNAETRNVIPKSTRIERGKVSVRHWHRDQIPSIGKKFGYLKDAKKKIAYTKYIQKGGVNKTTTTLFEARTYALHGLKTLVVGNDFELGANSVLLPQEELTNIEDIKYLPSLYHFFVESVPIEEIVVKTDLPTLHFIPENEALSSLDRWLQQQKRREYIYAERLMPLLSDYDVVIFDHNPGWTHLVENSIVASDSIVSPLGCSTLPYRSSVQNANTLLDFQDEMKITDQKLILFPTGLTNNSLSSQAYAKYTAQFPEYLINCPLRVSAVGDEAVSQQLSIMEYAPSSSLATQHYHLMISLWKALNQSYDEYMNTSYMQIDDEGEMV